MTGPAPRTSIRPPDTAAETTGTAAAPRPPRRPGLGILATVVVLAGLPAAFIAGIQAGANERLPPVTDEPSPIVLPATAEQRTGTTSAVLLLDRSPLPALSAPGWAGTVTAVHTAPGAVLHHGSPVLAVDGIDRIAAATPGPLFRTLAVTPGRAAVTSADPAVPSQPAVPPSYPRGVDVAWLHQLLVDLGHLDQLPETADRFTERSGAAVERLAAALGSPATGTFDPGWVLWLPTGAFPVAGVAAGVAQPAPPPGSTVVEQPPALAAARLADPGGEPLRLGPGYEVLVGDRVLALDDDGAAVPGELLHVLSDVGGDSVEVTSRLSTPVEVLVLPVSAVSGGNTGGLCVWVPAGDGYTARPVEVASGAPGSSEVSNGLAPGEPVLTNPADVLEDPTCPSP